jgi:hypothetical protein
LIAQFAQRVPTERTGKFAHPRLNDLNTRKNLGDRGHAVDTPTNPTQQISKTPAPRLAQLSGQRRGTRRFRLLVDCNGGQFPFEVRAQDGRTAFGMAAHDIAGLFPRLEAHQVRLLSCIELGA